MTEGGRSVRRAGDDCKESERDQRTQRKMAGGARRATPGAVDRLRIRPREPGFLEDGIAPGVDGDRHQ